MSFEINLPLFHGPFDLLLFFIERDELDINDIPISKITSEFLDYIEHLEKLNVEFASEFILVAATLMRIKAKMLVPRPDLDQEGKEIDPREELVQKLTEYKKYKSVIEELNKLEEDQLAKYARGNVIQEIKKIAQKDDVESELMDLDLFKLLKVFQKCVERFEKEQNKPFHSVVQYPYSIADQKEYVLNKVQTTQRVSFESIILDYPNKIAVIFNFLSILELLSVRLISIQIGEGFNNFWLVPNTEIDEKKSE